MKFYTVIDNFKIYLEGSYEPKIGDVLVINDVEYQIKTRVIQTTLCPFKLTAKGYYSEEKGNPIYNLNSEIYVKVEKL